MTPSIVDSSSFPAASPMTSWKRVSSSTYDWFAATLRSCALRSSRSSASCAGVMRAAARAAIAGSTTPRNSMTSETV